MNVRLIVTWALIILIFALGIYGAFWIHSQSYQCVSNPYVYSINLLEKANNAEVKAIVTTYPERGIPGSVLLTRDGFSPIKTNTSINIPGINFNFTPQE